MGCNQDKEAKLTREIKATKLTGRFKRKVFSNNVPTESDVDLVLHDGQLFGDKSIIRVELPGGNLKLIINDAYSKELTLYLDDGDRWILPMENLNTFLRWKKHLSISMRPALARTASSCTRCDRPFNLFRSQYHCQCCGRLFCDYCTRFLATLGFLGYNSEERICEECKKVVIRIKTEEAGAICNIKNPSKSFVVRGRSEIENTSSHLIIRQESTHSLIKTGCPSGLNTIS